MNETNPTKPSEQEVGYENTWHVIQSGIFASGLNSVRLKVRHDMPAVVARQQANESPYNLGVLHALQHFLARHNAKDLPDTGEPCL